MSCISFVQYNGAVFVLQIMHLPVGASTAPGYTWILGHHRHTSVAFIQACALMFRSLLVFRILLCCTNWVRVWSLTADDLPVSLFLRGLSGRTGTSLFPLRAMPPSERKPLAAAAGPPLPLHCQKTHESPVARRRGRLGELGVVGSKEWSECR